MSGLFIPLNNSKFTTIPLVDQAETRRGLGGIRDERGCSNCELMASLGDSESTIKYYSGRGIGEM